MQTNEEQLGLDELVSANTVRRRKLLPLWIKIFLWIFMIMGACTPFVLLVFALGGRSSLALYGLESNDPLSIVGILLFALFLLKGFVAYSLWFEKDWAIKLGILDATIGIIVCCGVMILVLMNQDMSFDFRLELLILIPYLSWLLKVKESWENKYATQ